MHEESKKKETAHQLLNVVWGILTTTCLLLVLFFIWQNEKLETRHQLTQVAQQISDNLDRFVDGVTQSINRINIHGHNFNQCQNTLLPELQELVFNDPSIAAVSLTDHNKVVLCSTFPQKSQAIIPKSPRALGLFGPVKPSQTNRPAFIIQQQLGQYFIEFYILRDELEKQLKIPSSLAKLVGLYNKAEDRIVLQMERDNMNNVWLNSSPTKYMDYQSIKKAMGTTLVSNDLIRLNNIAVILQADNIKLDELAWRYVLMAGFIIVLLSCSIYYYLRSMIHQHFSLHRAITNGIKNKDFIGVYQPLIDRRSNTCCGAEVLLRWRADDKETIKPDSFIDYAEQSGLIVPITTQLLEQVFNETKEILHSHPDFHLSVNLSSVHFSDGNFFNTFVELCRKHHIPANQIMLEVTERDLLQDDVNLIRRMKELRQLGFSIAVDDFGTGHASISYLQHFPFNYLKIDQLFVRAIGTGAVTETLNQAIIHMAKGLELHIIAEGVETYQQLDALEEHGVYLIQGWYFAREMNIDKLKQFLKRNT